MAGRNNHLRSALLLISLFAHPNPPWKLPFIPQPPAEAACWRPVQCRIAVCAGQVCVPMPGEARPPWPAVPRSGKGARITAPQRRPSTWGCAPRRPGSVPMSSAAMAWHDFGERQKIMMRSPLRARSATSCTRPLAMPGVAAGVARDRPQLVLQGISAGRPLRMVHPTMPLNAWGSLLVPPLHLGGRIEATPIKHMVPGKMHHIALSIFMLARQNEVGCVRCTAPDVQQERALRHACRQRPASSPNSCYLKRVSGFGLWDSCLHIQERLDNATSTGVGPSSRKACEHYAANPLLELWKERQDAAGGRFRQILHHRKVSEKLGSLCACDYGYTPQL